MREPDGMQIMLEPSPLRNLHEEYVASLRAGWPGAQPGDDESGPDGLFAVEYLPYGPSHSGDVSGAMAQSIEIVGTYGPVEAEYAAIRRGAGILDRPQRAVIRLRGRDRRGFLNRLLTQELKHLAASCVTRSFWLNRRGRIDADLLIVDRDEETLLDLDRHQRAATVAGLSSFVFTEDVEIGPADDLARLAIHGRRAVDVISSGGLATPPVLLAPGQAMQTAIAGAPIVVARNDEAGEVGLEIFAPAAKIADIWRALVSVAQSPGQGRRRVRPIGWHAYNIARIEAGTPLFNIDFGPTNLPHETGALRERVSFTKGCYLGQEVVARMEHLGKPKQILVGLKLVSDALPVAGAQVFEIKDELVGDQIGVVTSSTLSPMLSAAPIAFAMIRSRHAAAGTTVAVNAEGRQARALVHALRFWPEQDFAP